MHKKTTLRLDKTIQCKTTTKMKKTKHIAQRCEKNKFEMELWLPQRPEVNLTRSRFERSPPIEPPAEADMTP
jgi:hypothetical protein